LQAVLDGGGVLLPTEPGPNAPFAFLHNGQTEVPEGLIHGEVAFALLAVDSALELSTEEVCDGAVVNPEVLLPQPLSLVRLCFSRDVFVLLIGRLL